MDSEDDVGLMLAESAGRFLSEHHGPTRSRFYRTGAAGVDRAFWRQCAAQGWLGLRLPETLGGTGLSVRSAISLARAFGAHAVPDPLIACGLLPGAVLAGLPETGAAAAVAERLQDGSDMVSLAWQRAVGDIDPTPGAVAASTAASGLRLSGRAACVPWPAQTLLVLAWEDGAPVLAEVPAAALEWDRMMLSDGTALGTVTFDATPARMLCAGPPAFDAVRRGLLEARVATAALLEALASHALDITIGHCAKRVQFGKPLLEQQVVQHRLVDFRMQVKLSGASWRKALRSYEYDPDCHATRTAVHAAKARCSETALLVSRGAIQLHGAMGYTEEAEIGLFLRAAVRHAGSFGNAATHRAHVLDLAHGLELAGEAA